MHILQELGGWETELMVRRYAHLSAEHLAPYAEKIGRPRLIQGTKLAQDPNRKDVKELQVVD